MSAYHKSHPTIINGALCLGRPVGRVRKDWSKVTCPNCLKLDARTMAQRIPNRSDRLAVVEDIAGDCSDGVFWGLMDEFGLDASDLVED